MDTADDERKRSSTIGDSALSAVQPRMALLWAVTQQLDQRRFAIGRTATGGVGVGCRMALSGLAMLSLSAGGSCVGDAGVKLAEQLAISDSSRLCESSLSQGMSHVVASVAN